jgi:hypothetical protein
MTLAPILEVRLLLVHTDRMEHTSALTITNVLRTVVRWLLAGVVVVRMTRTD